MTTFGVISYSKVVVTTGGFQCTHAGHRENRMPKKLSPIEKVHEGRSTRIYNLLSNASNGTAGVPFTNID